MISRNETEVVESSASLSFKQDSGQQGSSMSHFRVNQDCNGCLACVQNCPAKALRYTDEADQRTLQHNMARCARCGHCWRVCPQEAIEFQHLLEGDWSDVVALNLMHCQICGESLFTEAYANTVQNRLNDDLQPLCNRHRKEFERLAQAHFWVDKKPID